MKLLYTLTTYPPSTGGAQIHQHRLACHLSPKHRINVVTHWDNNRTDWLLGTTINAPSLSRDYTIDEIAVHSMGYCICEKVCMFPFAASYYLLMMAGFAPVRPIASIIRKYIEPYAETADLIHNVRLGREGISVASYMSAKKHDIPFVLTPVHHPRWGGRKYRTFNNLYKAANALFALTNAEKEILISLGASPDRVHVIGHGPVIEKEAFPEDFLARHHIDGPMVLFLGQHYPYKGYNELLKAAPIVWEKFPRTHFVFIGPAVGQSESIFMQNPDPRILRLGNVSLQEKTDALAACSLLCVPSTQESFGGVYAEAWCFGKPVIGCPIPAVSEVISNGVDGFLAEQNPIQIAQKIVMLLEDDSLAAQIGAAGKKKVEEKYTWNRIAEHVETIYNSLI